MTEENINAVNDYNQTTGNLEELSDSDKKQNQVDLASQSTNDSISSMTVKGTSNLHSVTLTDNSETPLSSHPWVRNVQVEERRNKVGRPDPIAFVDKQSVEEMLEDPKTLTFDLMASFDKFDANKDGMLTPVELEDVFTNKTQSTRDRTVAASLRLGYGQYLDLDPMLSNDRDTFLTKSNVDGMGALYDSEKRDQLFENWWGRKKNNYYDLIKDRGWAMHALMGTALFYNRYIHAQDNFSTAIDRRLTSLETLPTVLNREKNEKLPLCNGKFSGDSCKLY